MPTISQFVRKSRKAKRKFSKSPILDNKCPFKRGVSSDFFRVAFLPERRGGYQNACRRLLACEFLCWKGKSAA